MESKCAGCLQNLPRREFLTCMYCSNSYDLECANISSKRFYNTMTLEHKTSWKCQACRCNTPKAGNADTPIHSRDHDTTGLELNNITTRKKPLITTNETLSSEDLSILGDTNQMEERSININKMQCELTLQNLSEMIAMQLKENNKSIISQLQITIQIEINKAVLKFKEDVTKEINNLSQKNKEQQMEIQLINTKIIKLEKTNEELNRGIKDLEEKLTTNQIRTYSPESNSKKIVLFGLAECYWEPESDLHNRINEIMREIMGVDLIGYIESTYRIGKYNNKNRPLVIELLSKRMAKYITENSHYFQGTNLSISDYLDENARKARKTMREEMFKARRNGLHAVIRNNQLYIEGKKTSSRGHNNTHGNSLLNTTNDREQMNLEQESRNVNNDQQWRHNYNNNSNNSFRKYNTTF